MLAAFPSSVLRLPQGMLRDTAPAYPPEGTLIQEIVYAKTAEVAAPGDR